MSYFLIEILPRQQLFEKLYILAQLIIIMYAQFKSEEWTRTIRIASIIRSKQDKLQ